MKGDKNTGSLGKLVDGEHDVYGPLNCAVYLLNYLFRGGEPF